MPQLILLSISLWLNEFCMRKSMPGKNILLLLDQKKKCTAYCSKELATFCVAAPFRQHWLTLLGAFFFLFFWNSLKMRYRKLPTLRDCLDFAFTTKAKHVCDCGHCSFSGRIFHYILVYTTLQVMESHAKHSISTIPPSDWQCAPHTSRCGR